MLGGRCLYPLSQPDGFSILQDYVTITNTNIFTIQETPYTGPHSHTTPLSLKQLLLSFLSVRPFPVPFFFVVEGGGAPLLPPQGPGVTNTSPC